MNTNGMATIESLTGALHFVGIGGAGMSGIAEVLLGLGCRIQGSDIVENATVKRLRQLGANVFVGHTKENISGADVVVVSSAIAGDNPEIQAAKEARIPVIKRAEMLAELMRFRFGIAIAGTHGKTTTTSLIATVLSSAGLDPTYVVGGKLESFGKHAVLGRSNYLVVEADESDASFLHLNPMLAVITNIDADHLGAYENDFDQLVSGFNQFLENLPFYSTAVVCNEDSVLRKLQQQVPRHFLTYGFSQDCDIYASAPVFEETASIFNLKTAWHDETVTVRLNLPGRHNILNALAAIGVAHVLQIDADKVYAVLSDFKGIARRFQNYGDVHAACGRVSVVDDYAHHPVEIKATYDAACGAWPGRRKVVVFQPHRYTRVHALFDEFTDVLASVDQLILLDVYPAGEQLIAGADSASLYRAVAARSKNKPIHVQHPDDVPVALDTVLQAEDVVLIMGAGSIASLAPDVVQYWRCGHAA